MHFDWKQLNLKKYRGLILIGLLAILADFFFLSKITVSAEPDQVLIQGGIVRCQIACADVTELQWLDGFTPGQRVNGVNTLNYYSGEFSGGSLDGEYRLFLDRHYTGRVLLIHTTEETVVLGSAQADLEGLYSTLAQHAPTAAALCHAAGSL